MTDTSKSKSRRVMEYLTTVPARQHFTSKDVKEATGLPSNITAPVAGRLRKKGFLVADPPSDEDRRHYRYRFPTKAIQKEYRRWLVNQPYQGEPKTHVHTKPMKVRKRERLYSRAAPKRLHVAAAIKEGQADMVTHVLEAMGAVNVTIKRWITEDDK